MHAHNLKASLAQEEQKEEAQNTSPVVMEHQHELATSRCREVYAGSKLFWRSQDTVDLSIYLHIAENCLEVIAFDYHSHTEYNRIYFNETTIFEYITPGVIRSNVDSYKSQTLKAAGARTVHFPPDQVLFDEERRVAVTSHILSRLVFHETLNENGLPARHIGYEYRENFDNPSGTSPLISKPADLTPVLIPRRRLSSSAEIEAAANDVTELQLAVAASLDKAESVAKKMLDSNAELFKRNGGTALL